MSHRVPSRNKAPHTGFLQDKNSQHRVPVSAQYVHQPHHNRTSHHTSVSPSSRMYRNSYINAGGATTIDTGLSDDTYTDVTYYEYAQNYQSINNYDDIRTTDSGSTRLPLYDSDDGNSISQNNFGYMEHRRSQYKSSTSSNTARDLRRVYPNNGGRITTYHEVRDGVVHPPQITQHPITSTGIARFSNRPQSSLSSAIGSTVVDGCGGKCQTCENVCYFFLQLVFTMGILIGVSLCIAGITLRKSAARNLQVLVYIGALVSLVSGLLLGIQCNARKNAKNRKKALWSAKRAPIQLDTLNIHGGNVGLPQTQPLMVVQENRTQRIVPVSTVDVQRQRNYAVSPNDSVEEQGIPWWRRKDLKK